MLALPTNAVKFSIYNAPPKLQSARVIAKLKPALPFPKSPLLPILPTIFSIRLYSSMSRFTCRVFSAVVPVPVVSNNRNRYIGTSGMEAPAPLAIRNFRESFLG